jgi:hypothetical protein
VKYPTEPRWLIETISHAGGWVNFVVIVLVGSERRNYHLAHNGSRFAKQTEFARFIEQLPGVAEEVCLWAEASH